MTSFKISRRHEKEKQSPSKNRRLVQNGASTHPAWPWSLLSCISLSLFGPAICRKKSLWKSNFHFPWQLTRAWSNQGTHTVLFVPLRSAQQADELLKTTIFLLCLLFWQCYGFYLHQKPYLYSSTLSVIFAIKNIVFLYTCRWIFFKLPTITKIQ